jgi:protein subunit release factor A
VGSKLNRPLSGVGMQAPPRCERRVYGPSGKDLMEYQEALDKLHEVMNLIERNQEVVESHVLQLGDWIKQKYRLMDWLKSARQKTVELNAVKSEAGRRDEPDSCIPTAEHEIALIENKIKSLQSQLSHVLTLAQDKDFDAVVAQLRAMR